MDAKILVGSLVGATLINAALAACASTNGANAQTAPTPVQVVTATCDKTFEVAGAPRPGGDGGLAMYTTYYAEAAFPGVSAQQLAGHVTNWNTPAAGYPMPPGYALRQQDVIYTRDGFAGAGCSQGGTTTFIYAP